MSRNEIGESVRDPLHGLIVANGMATLDNIFGPKPPGPPAVVSSGALVAAKSSGMTALNITMAHTDDFEGAVANIGKWDVFIREHPQDLIKIHTTEEIRLAGAQRKIGIIYGFQNAAMVGDKPGRVDLFADLGVKAIQLTYNAPNRLGGGCMAAGDPALTAFGHEVIERLNARHVMVDLSHGGRRMCLDAVKASKQPVCISHTGCAAITNLPRNVTDEQLRAVAENGGYVGIYFIMYLTIGRSSTSADVLAHMDHAIEICGEDHVGFGSDYGIVELGDMEAQWEFWAGVIEQRSAEDLAAAGECREILPFADDLIGPGQFRSLVGAMDSHGYSSSRIEKIMGQNYLRYAKEVWGA